MRKIFTLLSMFICLATFAQENTDTMFIYHNNGKIERILVSGIDSVTFVSPYAVKAIDLGLSVKWASYNIGASSPEEVGSYFAWGEIEEKDEYSLETYFDKYSSYFSTGGKNSISGTEYDVATVLWGPEWSIPTYEQVLELYVMCQWTWTDNYKLTGVAGMVCTGPNGNHIFLPAGGLIMGTEHSYPDYGNYWAGSLERYNNIDWANFIDFNRNGISYNFISRDYRFWGRNIRPVKK